MKDLSRVLFELPPLRMAAASLGSALDSGIIALLSPHLHALAVI